MVYVFYLKCKMCIKMCNKNRNVVKIPPKRLKDKKKKKRGRVCSIEGHLSGSKSNSYAGRADEWEGGR